MHTPFPPPRRGMTRRTAAVLAAGALAAPWVRAQTAWPQQPIKLVIPYPPGGGGDAVGRPLALALERKLGVPVVLDYRPGAGGTIAAQLVTSARADGYTLYLGDNGAVSVAPSYRSVGYGPADFTYLGGIGELPLVLVTHPGVKANNIQELAALSRVDPGGLSYASGGIATVHHLLAEMMRLQANINAVHVAYKGSGPASTDLIAGVVDYAFLAPAGVVQHVRSGRLRAVAVTSRQRLADFPSVSTVAELGFPGLQMSIMSALLGPMDLPASVSTQLAVALSSVLAEPGLVKSLETTGLQVTPHAPGVMREAFEQDMQKWRDLIQTTKLKLD